MSANELDTFVVLNGRADQISRLNSGPEYLRPLIAEPSLQNCSIVAVVGDAQLRAGPTYDLASARGIVRSGVTYFIAGSCTERNWAQLKSQALISPMYRIREVDGSDDDVADTLSELHRLTFFDGAPVPGFDYGHWWLASEEVQPVAFAGVIPSVYVPNAGYFCRVGVLSRHWGRGLQLRLMRALEARARLNGWCSVISDTTDNVPSANNFIRARYQLYQPRIPWAWPNTLYWHKLIR